jgi:hypothetical protein
LLRPITKTERKSELKLMSGSLNRRSQGWFQIKSKLFIAVLKVGFKLNQIYLQVPWNQICY